jgi:SAM-dependent methyltransferase
MPVLTYNPGVFDVPDLETARQIILTNEPDVASEERWRRETPYLSAMTAALLMPGEDSLVLDYGCGIGRLAKELIAQLGCRVLGVDISQSMRRLAVDYVGSERFEAISPETFDARVAAGLRVDGALAIWVIQHCLDPVATVRSISGSLAPAARLFVVNTNVRCVPAVEKPWARDGIVVKDVLATQLRQASGGELDARFVGNQTSKTSFWAAYHGG